MHARVVTFSVARRGNDDAEWQDGAASSPGDGNGVPPRVAVTDGATGGFEAASWAAQLAAGFVGPGRPVLAVPDLGAWLIEEQARWRSDPRWRDLSPFARRKLEDTGSFATFLGCELTGLDGPRPGWRGAALGDTVLFHVRGAALLDLLPRMDADQFGYNPDGVPTDPATLATMVSAFAFGAGDLAPGDRLFLATDALAHWMIVENRRAPGVLWSVLTGLDHPDAFGRLVHDRWRSGELAEDDVTLMRVHIAAAPPEHLVVCL